MTGEVMILDQKFRDEHGQHEVVVFELSENDVVNGKYRCLIDRKDSIILEWKDDKWYEGEKETERAKAIGELVKEYEDS
jgi:hypothetical protein